jgi:hypothetical protein
MPATAGRAVMVSAVSVRAEMTGILRPGADKAHERI